jgi:hypothetical protein
MLRHRILLAALVVILAPAATRAEPLDDEGPTAKPTVDAELKALAERYGAAAVALQAHLLAQAISAGSQLEATISIVGNEARDGHEYLTYALDTGIVYAVADLTTAQQLERIWSDVVEPSLRRAALTKLRSHGLALRVRSYRSQLVDRALLVREREAGRLQPVATTFVLPLDAIRGFFDGTLNVDELNTRSVIELNGVATALAITATPVPTAEPDPNSSPSP